MTSQDITSSGLSIARAQADDQSYSIPYRPQYAAIAGSVTSALLLQQINYWWHKSKREPFYKFKDTCEHVLYRAGDSWCEELGFTRAIFDGALQKIATKIRTGMNKSEELNRNIVIYWTDSNHMTWYQVNETLLGAYVYLAYNDPATLAKVEKSLYLGESGKLLYLDKAGKSLYLYSESTSETSTYISPSGEKMPPPEPNELGFKTPSQAKPKTKEEHLQGLRDAVGDDPLDGAMLALQNASEKPMSIPPQAGGADPWEPAADAFCCMHGFRLADIPPNRQQNWRRELQRIGEAARIRPVQLIAAIRILPETELAFKVGGYTTPHKTSFADDVVMVAMKLATGQLQPKGQQSKSWSGSL